MEEKEVTTNRILIIKPFEKDLSIEEASKRTITAKDLKEFIKNLSDDTKIIIDTMGWEPFTYGVINSNSFETEILI